MSENKEEKKEEVKKEEHSKKSNTNVYIKQSKCGTSTFLIVVVTAVIAGMVGSAGMYFALNKSNNSTENLGSNDTSVSKKIEIESTDSPVVAIAQKAGS